ILAAHLGDAGLRVGTALELAGDLSADLEGACEGHPGSERMLDERRADRATRAGKIVEYARWNFCVTDAVGQQPSGPGRRGGALQYDGVAGDQRRGDLARSERNGEVERRDHHPGAVGLEHTAVVRRVALERIVRQRPLKRTGALEV